MACALDRSRQLSDGAGARARRGRSCSMRISRWCVAARVRCHGGNRSRAGCAARMDRAHLREPVRLVRPATADVGCSHHPVAVADKPALRDRRKPAKPRGRAARYGACCCPLQPSPCCGVDATSRTAPPVVRYAPLTVMAFLTGSTAAPSRAGVSRGDSSLAMIGAGTWRAGVPRGARGMRRYPRPRRDPRASTGSRQFRRVHAPRARSRRSHHTRILDTAACRPRDTRSLRSSIPFPQHSTTPALARSLQ